MLSAIWAITLLAVVLLATARSRMIEPMFGGLDRAVRLHRRLGPTAIGLVVLHVLLYLPPMLGAGVPLGDILVPFWSPEARTFDAIVLWTLLAWTGLAYVRGLPYEGWLSLHGLMGPIFLGAGVHSVLEGSTVLAFEPLRFWMWFLVLVGVGAWAYRVLLYRWFAPRYRYRVEAVEPRSGDTIDLVLRPRDRRMIYEPGTFVFIRRPGRAEYHPFSISSSPAERNLRLSVRMLGDFTRALATAPRGEVMEVFGPFGSFTPHRYAHYRRLVCVGAGIGITPFLGMLRFEMTNDDFRRIWLWYVVRDAENAPYDAEIRDLALRADSWIDYDLWITPERGRITAAQVMAAVRPLDDYAVMLCGRPEFVGDMVRQFLAEGLPRERLVWEDFHFN
ncbi:ferric reductase-like transmembrane domain-containing protein [Stella sp.]|uniref:ferredoxin reductase family protein n=1 Tax=Stella sp. TaxID=2912054 RepID=UPI0035B03101